MKDETILVVDNNHVVTDFLSKELLPILGYRTAAAHDGQAALKRIKAQPPDLILLDLQLPDMDGLEVMRRLAGADCNIPTIIVTGHGSEELAVDAFRLGAHDYLIKPIEVTRLNATISRALAESRLRREKADLVQQLRQQVNWLTVLSKVGQSVTSILELDKVLTRIVDTAVYLTKAEEGFLVLADQDGEHLRLRAQKNIEQAHSQNLNLRLHDSLVGLSVRTRRPLRLSGNGDGQTLKVSTGFLVHSVLHVPILSKGRALGVLSVDNRTNRQAFTDMDEMLLTSLADYAAVAIENARLYEQAQQEIGERKRVENELAASLKEKDILLQEVHHRVKNNLQVISSMLNLQAGYVEDDTVLDLLQDSQTRIRSMALIHEKLYQSNNLARIDFGEYARELATYLFNAQKAKARGVRLECQVSSLFLEIGAAVPCGLILNELVSNALKHAFPEGRSGEIWVVFRANEAGWPTLIVADNGVGLPPESDWRTTQSLGLQLVNALVSQLEGTFEVTSKGGAQFRVTFPDQ